MVQQPIAPGRMAADELDPVSRPLFGPGRLAQVPFLGVAGFVLVLVVWELSRYVADLRPLLPYPTGVVQALWDLTVGNARGEFVPGILATARFILTGFLVAVVVGTVLGFVAGRYRRARMAIYPYLNVLYATPRVALIPLIIVWFGLGATTAITVVVLSCSFHIAIGAAEGVRNSSAPFLPVATSFGANEWTTVTKVVLPAAIPYLIASWRLGAGRAVVAALIAELYLDQGVGLGRLLDRYSLSLALERAFAVVVVITLLGLVFMHSFSLLGRLLARRFGTAATAIG